MSYKTANGQQFRGWQSILCLSLQMIGFTINKTLILTLHGIKKNRRVNVLKQNKNSFRREMIDRFT